MSILFEDLVLDFILQFREFAAPEEIVEFFNEKYGSDTLVEATDEATVGNHAADLPEWQDVDTHWFGWRGVDGGLRTLYADFYRGGLANVHCGQGIGGLFGKEPSNRYIEDTLMPKIVGNIGPSHEIRDIPFRGPTIHDQNRRLVIALRVLAAGVAVWITDDSRL